MRSTMSLSKILRHPNFRQKRLPKMIKIAQSGTSLLKQPKTSFLRFFMSLLKINISLGVW